MDGVHYPPQVMSAYRAACDRVKAASTGVMVLVGTAFGSGAGEIGLEDAHVHSLLAKTILGGVCLLSAAGSGVQALFPLGRAERERNALAREYPGIQQQSLEELYRDRTP